MKKLIKIKQSVFKGVIKPKIFLILFAFIFSSLAFAASLTVTFLDGRIPTHNSSTCTSSEGFAANTPEFDTLNVDSTEDPQDVIFSTDGLIVFTTNLSQESPRKQGNLSMNRLSRPFDMTSVISDNTPGVGKPSLNCNDIDAFRVNQSIGFLLLRHQLVGINIVDNGTKFFISADNGNIARFDLSTPNEFSTRTFVNVLSTSANEDNFALSTDGTKLFTINETNDAPVVTTYSLPGPFDISSKTQIHQVDLTTIGVEDETGNDKGDDIEFNETGSAMFVLISNDTESSLNGPRPNSYIYHYSLGKNFDVSTASLIGRYQVNDFGNVAAAREGTGMPRGFSFSADGMRIYIVQEQNGDGVDQINSFQLECPYGLIICVSETSSSIESQVELVKQNVSLNVNTIFKRFEWIKRNRDDENLTAHNFKINYEDPLIKSLANKFEPSVRNNVASFISKHKTENKKSKWSSWSLADISLSIFEKNGSVNAKDLNTRGLTLGADRKFGDNKFLGWAIRYSDGSADTKFSRQDLTMESLTLNLYGVSPSKDNQYINAVLGFSHLRFDHRYLGNLSGERNGKQAFASINYRTKDKYGILNVTPTGKLTYGVTRLSEFTDYITKASGLPATDVLYKEDTFTSGELAAGFLFETDIIKTDQGTLQPMGGIEILYDLTSDVDYKYVYQGGTHVNKDRIHSPFSSKNLKTSIGFEAIHLNGFTVSADFQRLIRLNDTKNAPEFQSDTFILKFSRSKEEDNQFALNYDPINAHQTNLSYSKNIHGLDFKINSNQSLENSSEYFTNLEVSGKF